MTDDRITRGDRVRVEQDGDHLVTGSVEQIATEWGRRGFTIFDDDGAGWTVWERSDRTIEKIDDDGQNGGRRSAPGGAA